MADLENQAEQLDLSIASADGEKLKKLEKERERLLASVVAASLDDMQTKVAWLLNAYPEARDSDIALQLRFWEAFEDELLDGDSVELKNLYKLSRLTSLTRARARIQNKLGLFKASPVVRARRGKLSEEERKKLAEESPPAPGIAVYSDESGKQGQHLIVASVWFLHAPETLAVVNAINAWRATEKFSDEFHFRDITSANVRFYEAFVERFLSKSSTVSFKAISVPRAGLKNVSASLEELHYHLVRRGVEREHETGRASLPRSLHLTKDEEEKGADALFLRSLEERLRIASGSFFDKKLRIDEFHSVPSENQPLVQMADLVAGSLNRLLNATGARDTPKDMFADYLLSRIGMGGGLSIEEFAGDMSVHIQL